VIDDDDDVSKRASGEVQGHYHTRLGKNRTILAKLYYNELFGQNQFFHTFFWAKIALFRAFLQKLHFSETKSTFFPNFTTTFPDAL